MERNIVYAIQPLEDAKTMSKIVDVVQKALDGRYDMFAFNEREIVLDALSEFNI